MSSFEGKPFSDLLREIRNGDLNDELTEAYYKMSRAVQDTRKAGTLTLKVKITPTGKATVEIDADHEAKEPKHDKPSTTFFVGKDGGLTRNDPNQGRLPLREVGKEADAEEEKVAG